MLCRWRTLLGIGGALLTTSFFLPESVSTFTLGWFQSRSEPDIPISEILAEFSEGAPSVENVLESVFEYLLPHVFGLICVLIAIRGLDFRLKVQRNLGSSITVFFAVMLLIMGVGTLVNLPGSIGSNDIFACLIVLAVELLQLLVLIRCFRSRLSGALCARWMLALFYFFYFLLFSAFIFEAPLYGNWVSLAGTALILIASFAEAQIRSSTGWLVCLWTLIRVRVDLVDLEGSQCFECGYLLIGLRSHRCPECGLEFNPAEHGLDAENPALHSTTCQDR